jgi:uncharacterized protein (DUF58 family)
MLDANFFSELNRFEFMVRKRVASVYAGKRHSVRIGRGVGVVDYRGYLPGDDIKSIDWKLYARTEKLYIKRFEEEKEASVHILLDASRSMDFGEPRKFDYAARLALGIAYLFNKQNEKFSINTFSEEVEINPLRNGKGYLLEAIERLNRLRLEGRTDIDSCSRKYSGVIKSRSMVVLLSDFLDELDSIKRCVHRFSKHDLILIHVADTSEMKLDLWGDVRLHDLETRRVMKTYISPRLREEYHQLLSAHLNGIEDVCHHAGAEFYSFTTDVPLFDAFFKIVQAR